MSDVLLSTVGTPVPVQRRANYRCESCHQTGRRLYELAVIGLSEIDPLPLGPFLVCETCLPG